MLNLNASLIIDLQGFEISAEEKELLQHPLVCGVILFARNYQSYAQLKKLCRSIRECKKTLLIVVDQEGGRVQRFNEDFTALPSMSWFGNLFDQSPLKGLMFAEDCAWLMANELLEVGIDLSLAPVLDLNKGISKVIGDRAFHSQPDIVAQLAKAFMKGMRQAGMAATGKHFPGHGSIAIDTHTGIAKDLRDLKTIVAEDLSVFVELIHAGIPSLMTSHIIFPHVDSCPVSFSKVWLKDILRRQFGFTGIIFSDDLNMEGAKIGSNHADRFMAAREAGCDVAMLCNNRIAVVNIIDTVQVTSAENNYVFTALQGKLPQTNFKESIRLLNAKAILTKETT